MPCGASPGAYFLRAKSPAPYQPRATPWETRRENHLSPEGATQPPRPNMTRPFRAQWEENPKTRAMPWAGMGRTVGAEDSEHDLLFHDTVAPQPHRLPLEGSAAQQRDYHTQFYMMLNTANRLVCKRLTADSPDHFSICKQEGII